MDTLSKMTDLNYFKSHFPYTFKTDLDVAPCFFENKRSLIIFVMVIAQYLSHLGQKIKLSRMMSL